MSIQDNTIETVRDAVRLAADLLDAVQYHGTADRLRRARTRSAIARIAREARVSLERDYARSLRQPMIVSSGYALASEACAELIA